MRKYSQVSDNIFHGDDGPWIGQSLSCLPSRRACVSSHVPQIGETEIATEASDDWWPNQDQPKCVDLFKVMQIIGSHTRCRLLFVRLGYPINAARWIQVSSHVLINVCFGREFASPVVLYSGAGGNHCPPQRQRRSHTPKLSQLSDQRQAYVLQHVLLAQPTRLHPRGPGTDRRNGSSSILCTVHRVRCRLFPFVPRCSSVWHLLVGLRVGVWQTKTCQLYAHRVHACPRRDARVAIQNQTNYDLWEAARWSKLVQQSMANSHHERDYVLLSRGAAQPDALSLRPLSANVSTGQGK